MLLSLNWLSDFIDLKGLNNDEIIEQMVRCGFEVEGIEKLSDASNLIVGEVLENKPRFLNKSKRFVFLKK